MLADVDGKVFALPIIAPVGIVTSKKGEYFPSYLAFFLVLMEENSLWNTHQASYSVDWALAGSHWHSVDWPVAERSGENRKTLLLDSVNRYDQIFIGKSRRAKSPVEPAVESSKHCRGRWHWEYSRSVDWPRLQRPFEPGLGYAELPPVTVADVALELQEKCEEFV